MRTLDKLFRTKMAATEFEALYHQECNVCSKTVGIFERLEQQGISLQTLAAELNEDNADLQSLCDADHCDPHLVTRLCRHLGLPLPDTCPRRV